MAQLKKLNCQNGFSSLVFPGFRAFAGTAGTPSTIEGLAWTFFEAFDDFCFGSGGGVIYQTTDRSTIGLAAFAASFEAIAFSAAAS